MVLTDCRPNRAASLGTRQAGGNDVCMVLSIEYLGTFPGAAGGLSYSSKKKTNPTVK